jgi:hypothetical protein
MYIYISCVQNPEAFMAPSACNLVQPTQLFKTKVSHMQLILYANKIPVRYEIKETDSPKQSNRKILNS